MNLSRFHSPVAQTQISEDENVTPSKMMDELQINALLLFNFIFLTPGKFTVVY